LSVVTFGVPASTALQ